MPFQGSVHIARFTPYFDWFFLPTGLKEDGFHVNGRRAQ